MGLSKDIESVLYTEEQLRTRIAELGAQITKDYQGKDKILLVSVLKGSYIFMADLSRAIDLPLTIDFMVVSSYGGSTQSSGQVEIKKDIPIFSPGGYSQSSSSRQYTLDMISIADGWGNDLYYYSPPPYQSYVLWSAGKNGRTFPPWIPRETLNEEANRCIGYWVKDDIVNLSH